MPTEVISTIHQLEAACIRYKGIVFTDKDGNWINNINNLDTEKQMKWVIQQQCRNYRSGWKRHQIRHNNTNRADHRSGNRWHKTDHRSGRLFHNKKWRKQLHRKCQKLGRWTGRRSQRCWCRWQHIQRERVSQRSLCNNKQCKYSTKMNTAQMNIDP